MFVPFIKYHGLGNDYLVIDPRHLPQDQISNDLVARICDRHFGVGADGVMYGPIFKGKEMHAVIYNSDGSIPENCGNGLRILGKSLYDNGYVLDTKFTIHITAGAMPMEIIDLETSIIKTRMGGYQLVEENLTLDLKEQQITGTAIRVGNPHFVTFVNKSTPEIAKELGPMIEHHPHFPNRTNCQFVEVLDPENIKIHIWERGSEYTHASGSSSSASACVAHLLGHCGSEITVHMPYGALKVFIQDKDNIYLTGPVQRVMEGKVDLKALSGDAFIPNRAA